MKKLSLISLLFMLFVINACSKFESRNTRFDLVTDEIIPSEKENLAQYAEGACIVVDGNGNETCSGTRCTTPIGRCGARKATKCKCVSMIAGDYELPEGMTPEDFIRTWNDSLGNIYLTKLGYFEK